MVRRLRELPLHLAGLRKDRFRRYNFCLRLSCATSIRRDFQPSTTRAIYTYDIHNVLYECRGSNLYDTICREVAC